MSDPAFTVSIAAGSRTIVSCERFAIPHNRITYLFGESGIGKSMLCKALYGMLNADDLDITVNGRRYREYCKMDAVQAVRASSFFVFQEPSSHLNPLMRIDEQLDEGSLADVDDDDILAYFWQHSPKTRLSAILPVYPKPYRPSGGEKQRIMLAMAFKKLRKRVGGAGAPTFFVFDEPTGSLDNSYRNLFLDYLYAEHERQPFSAVVITHDYSIISEICSKHPHRVAQTTFKELARVGDGRVSLDDFSTGDYLSWLKSTASHARRPHGDELVLSMRSRFAIFDRVHTLYRDRSHSHEADLHLHRGAMVYVKAPSGVGKTTLAKIIMGLYGAQKLSMTLCGIDITEKTPRAVWEKDIWGRKAGMIFQHADEALDMEATIRESFKGLPLAEPLTDKDLTFALQEMYDTTITAAFLSKKVKHLSGGQKQRLNLLRTMILQPDLIILDEPLNGLDFDSVRKIISMLGVLQKKGSALLMISHNEEIFDAIVDPVDVYYLK